MLTPDQEATALADKGFVFSHNATVTGETEFWTEFQSYISRAHELEGTSSLIKSQIYSQEAHAYEKKGDYAESGSQVENKSYQESLRLLEEAERMHTDHETQRSYLRVQAKLHPNLTSITDRKTGSFVGIGNVELEGLPQGPSYPHEESGEEDRKPTFLGEPPN